MSIVEFGEPEKCTFALPLHGIIFLNPMTCNGKITISVAGLPYIAGDIDGPTNSVTLNLITPYQRKVCLDLRKK